ncbi:MAG: hypothetical protein KIH69_007310 [Anaerolineae bacterium]|nr:hypothetical protein [Anaerolineae bacterium]
MVLTLSRAVTDYVRSLGEVSLFRWFRLIGGLFCFALGIAQCKIADIGLGPWDVFADGISKTLGISFGTAIIMVGWPLLLLWIPLRQRPGIATIANILLIGNFVNWVLPLSPQFAALPLRIAQYLVGIIVTGFGTGLYVGARLGTGPRDGLMIGLTRVTGWSVRVARTCIEVVVLTLGWLMGGSVGFGTLLTALFIGPVIQWWFRVMKLRPK